MTENHSLIPAAEVALNTGSAVPFSVGNALREARTLQGLSYDEVSHRIKFAPRQITALEADDFEHLPEAAFVRGFVRSYARLLQLDPAPLLAALPNAPIAAAMPETKVQSEVPYPDSYTERKQNIMWLAAAGVIVIGLVLAAWLMGEKPMEPNSTHVVSSDGRNATVETLVLPAMTPVSAVPEIAPVSAVSGVPLVSASAVVVPQVIVAQVMAPPVKTLQISVPQMRVPPAMVPQIQGKPVAEKIAPELKPAAPVKSAPQAIAPPALPTVAVPVKPAAQPGVVNNGTETATAAIKLTFDSDSWVEITDKHGKILLSQINAPGSEQSISGTPPFALVIGHAKEVHLFYKGRAVDLAPYTKVAVAHLTLE